MKTFYSTVFGWELQVDPEPDFGGYVTARTENGTVCGLMAAQNENMPNAWNVYLATDDIDTTLKNVEALGGKIMMPKMVVGDHGTMAVVQDPQGAVVSFWQADKMIGSTVANEMNTITWDELATKDLSAAKKFYNELCGWTEAEEPNDEYYSFAVNGEMRGGARELSTNEANMHSYWSVYFRVEDLEKAEKKVEAAGGKVLTPKMNAGPIEFQACMDDQNAIFVNCQFEDGAQ